VDTWDAVRSLAVCDAVPVQVEVVQDHPVTALLDRCGPDDVLVVGTRGGGTLAGLVYGSVARGVLDGLVCDVMVVPPGLVGRGAARRAGSPNALQNT
jgi:nucleotide-binding universal stress UspA family protein